MFTEHDASGGNVSNQYSRDASSNLGRTPTFMTEMVFMFHLSPSRQMSGPYSQPRSMPRSLSPESFKIQRKE